MRLGGRWVILICGAAMGLALAGCGGGTASPPNSSGSRNPLLTAYNVTMSVKSAKVTLHETVSLPGEQISVSGSGVIDFGKKDGEFSVTVPDVGLVKEVMVFPELYVQLPPALRSKIPGGKSWISLNLNRLLKAKLGASLGELSSSSQAPAETLSYLQSVSNNVKQAGTSKLDGVSVTKYDATLNLTKATRSKSPQVKAAVSKLEGLLHRSTLPLQVWIDGQRRVRQISYQFSVQGTSGQTEHLALKMDFASFGAPVSVIAPPASETYDATPAALQGGTTSG